MAQPPGHFLAQQQQGMSGPSLQQMLGQKSVSGSLPTGMQPHQPNMNAGGQTTLHERTIVDDFEASYIGLLSPLLPGTENVNKLSFSQDRLRSSVDLAVSEFTDQARKVEAYFLKKHATVARQQPELILQEEIEELMEEISRRDNTIRNHLTKVKQWTESVRTLQNSLNERPSTAAIGVAPGPQSQPSQAHPDAVQQQINQRR